MIRLRHALTSVVIASALASAGASAGIWQKNMTFDNDASTWEFHKNNNNTISRVTTSSTVARSGSKAGYVAAFSGWSGIGRNITLPSYTSRDYALCVAGIYARGERSYLEMIDTATWTYLRPLAHKPYSSSYKLVSSGGWNNPKKDVFLRYVANSGLSGISTYSWSYVDDAIIKCVY